MNGGDKYFVGTNVLLYGYDISSESKQQRARTWMDWLWGNAAAHVSRQVLQSSTITRCTSWACRPMTRGQP